MMESDKSSRILLLYSKLIRGLPVRKAAFCFDQNITARTFDRYIEDIRLFLSKSYSGKELIYDRKEHLYYIDGIQKENYLSGMEASALIAILKGSGAITSDEYTALIHHILAVVETEKREVVASTAGQDRERSQCCQERKGLLKLQWDLQQCIYARNIIHLKYFDNAGKIQQETVCPIEIRVENGEFYLIVLHEGHKETKIYALSKIESFAVSMRKYDVLLRGLCDVNELL